MIADPPTEPCADLAGEARDLCWVQQVESVLEADPQRALVHVESMSRGLIRDSTLLMIVRSSSLRVCRQIDDPGVKEACRAVILRPHLKARDPSATEAMEQGQTAAVAAVVHACNEGEATDRARCLERAAPGLGSFPEQLSVCNQIRATPPRMRCSYSLGTQFVTTESVQASQQACDTLMSREAQSECRFKLAEAMWPRPVSERIEMCIAAKTHTRSCLGHVINRVTVETIHRSTSGSFKALVDSLRAVEDNIQAGATPAGGATRLTSNQFWYPAFRHLLSHVEPATDLVRWSSMGTVFAEDDARRHVWMLAIAGEWARRRWLPEHASATGPPSPTLRSMAAMFEADLGAVRGLATLPGHRLPLPGGPPRDDLAALSGGQRLLPLLVRASPDDMATRSEGAIVALPAMSIRVDALRAALLWGVIEAPTPAALVQVLLDDAYRADRPRLRLTALESTLFWMALSEGEYRDGSSEMGRPRGDWIQGRTARIAAEDEDEIVRRCANMVSETARTRSRSRAANWREDCRPAD